MQRIATTTLLLAAWLASSTGAHAEEAQNGATASMKDEPQDFRGIESMKSEPRDFRGIAWDSAFEEQRAVMSLIRQEGDVAYYKRNGEPLTFAQADAFRIGYRYYKNRFSAGVIQTYGRSNQRTLVAALHSMHGTPQKPRKHIDQYIWEGGEAAIVLTCEITTYCAAEFFSVALRKLEAEETGNATTFDTDRD